jgi:prepilin-type N-terminal cleavage/methylation domain-containing protein
MTLIELVVAMAIAGILIGISAYGFGQWQQNQTLATTTRSMADAFSFARTEAIRTGNVHILYLATGGGTDIAGNALTDRKGNPVPLLILNDGPVGSLGQNCIIDAGEPISTLPMVQGLAWGFSASGGVKAPGDTTAPGNATGSSFATPADNPNNGIAFGADGVPIAFDLACNFGGFGTGNGGVYITNGTRDYAVVLQPLGAVRMHGWDPSAAAWKN